MNSMKLPENFSYKFDDANSGLDDDSEFRVFVKDIKDEPAVLNWIDELQRISLNTWRISKTIRDKGKLNSFKQFRYCQHAEDRRVRGVRSSKSTGCPATMQITIRRYHKAVHGKSQKTDPDWPAEVVFRSAHNHASTSAAVLKYRDMSEVTRQRLRQLFRLGHSASSALHCLKTDLLIEHGDNYYIYAADGFHVPSLSIVCKLFSAEFEAEYGSFNGSDMFACLEEMLAKYCADGICKANFARIGEHYYVSLCTPLMSRAHEYLFQTSELMMVDAAGGLDRQRHRLYLFITTSAAGGIPIGAIITSCEREDVFSEALEALINCFPSGAFFGTRMPRVIMTDNDLKERQPLQKYFPNARLLLCQFHMLKAVWGWLCNSNHGISSNHRQALYMAFKDVLYAPSEEEMVEKNAKLMEIINSEENVRCMSYFERLWNNRQDWALAFRAGLPLRGSNTTNYVEVAFRLIKDCVFDRVMAFNLTQLLDFIVTRYESYVTKRLIDFSSGRYCKALLRNMTPAVTEIPDDRIHAVDIANGQYSVQSMSGSEYLVDLVKGYCTCVAGSSGKLCNHASAVLLFVDHDIYTKFNIVSTESKMTLFKVATGNTPPSDWFLPLTSCPADAMSSTNLTDSDAYDASVHDTLHSDAIPTCSNDIEPLSLSAEEVSQLDGLFMKIKQGLSEAPDTFVPACRHMLQNANKYASTEAGLVTAMHTFAKYSGLQTAVTKPQAGSSVRRRGVQIGVQPTAIGRRRLTLSGKRRVSAGRTSGAARLPKQLDVHNYTTLGVLPSRKRKAPHSLQQCVYANVGLGGRKQAKS